MTSSPGAASTGLPLIVRTTTSVGAWVSDTGGLRLGDVGLAADGDGRVARPAAVGEELVLEAHDGRRDRGHGGGAERADRRLAGRPGDPGADVVAHVEQEAHVLGPAVAVEDAEQDLL